LKKRLKAYRKPIRPTPRVKNIDQNTTDMLRDQAWNMAVNENTLNKEYEKVGVSCGQEELYDMVAGKNIHPQIKQAFTILKPGCLTLKQSFVF